MNVLFWVDRFPTYSETFIRDQIVSLIGEHIEVFIYSNGSQFNYEEIGALKGFGSKGLSQRFIDIDCYFSKNKVKRLLSFLTILFTIFFNGQFKYYARALNVRYYGEMARSLRLFFRVHYILKNNINIIHAHFGPNGNKAAIFKELGLPIKLFCTFHGYDIRLGIKNGGHIYKTLFKEADGIIAISDYNYNHLIDFGADTSKLINLPNGIDTDFFKRTEMFPQAPIIKLLSVARLVEEKSLDLAIKAISAITKDKPDLRIDYTIIGEGKERGALETLIHTLELDACVHLVGYKSTDEVKQLMVRSDIFLLPSQAEALPTVLLEAQACEMVVLATNVGSVNNMVKGGLVVKPNDLDAFKNGLLELFKIKLKWNDIGQEGRAYVCTYHDINNHVKTLIAYYKQ